MSATYRNLTPEKVQYLIVHCAATRPSMDVGVKEIRKWHLQRGFNDVGYHYVIRRDGSIEKGRADTIPGAHAEGYNGKSLGVCLVGGVSENDVKVAENNFTEAQFDALHTLLRQLRASHPNAKVIGHREVNRGKACPSFDVQEWLIRNPI
ncbi:N-acetylmuramoyl-L-alanine amidase [Stenotrophomonas maltophilia]|uniref:N-acetylmuramoyl-L-alanine amidase n=1 Tax=Stenotrophomonas maltophilia TaxID=40324 RepID=UPI002090A9D1|nr:N-acetylmuramoyl-L-alanine amidase [Stenotrophomonas maltophilia]MCO5735946.1 N-acetylmuramoyl-L-alanine amidase [Stenotrophomonas maltophilia]